ncbi:MAG: hypothetical protein HS111_10310 [Kofleriaceae bacterium]|nr:hypothetical protein [Kofleriaceae bacterium]
MIEIPRNITANLWKLGLGIGLVVIAVLLMIDAPRLWIGPVLFAVPGIPLIISNALLIATRRPWLRATSEGAWFGGGPTISWRDISGIYEAGVPIERYGYSVRTRAIGFAFHRKRSLFRLPSTLWLTTSAFGDVRISTYAVDELPSTLVGMLEDMRRAACGEENGVVRGTSEIPAARLIPRA